MYGHAGASAATQLTLLNEPVQTNNASGLAAQSAAITPSAPAGAQQRRCRSWTPPYRPRSCDFVIDCSHCPRRGRPIAGHSRVWIFLARQTLGVTGPQLQFLEHDSLSDCSCRVTRLRPLLGLLAESRCAGDVLGEATSSGLGGSWWRRLAQRALAQIVSWPVPGNAATVGTLSVPPSWTAAAPLASPLPALGGTPMYRPRSGGRHARNASAPWWSAFRALCPQYASAPNPVAARPPAAGDPVVGSLKAPGSRWRSRIADSAFPVNTGVGRAKHSV